MTTQNTLDFPLTSALEVIRGGAFRDDDELFEELALLAAPSYQDAFPMLRREWNRCDTLYLLYDDTLGVAGFHLANFETLEIEGRCVPALYAGLSVLRDNKKQSSLAGLLYAVGLADAMDWEEAGGERLAIWGTTATPVVYLGLWKALASINPRPDGSYAPESVRLALALRRRYGLPQSECEHPFVLKGVARDTLYSPPELERLERLCGSKGLRVFDVLGVQRAQGDRLLFTARVPRAGDQPLSSAVWQVAQRLRQERQR